MFGHRSMKITDYEFIPLLSKQLDVGLVDFIIHTVAGYGFVVQEGAFRAVQHLAAFLPDPQAIIDILETVDEGCIEAAQGQEAFASRKEAGTGGRIDFPVDIYSFIVGVDMFVVMLRKSGTPE